MTHPAPDERAARHNTTPISFGLFQREQRSLFGEILDWMLTPLLLLWPLSLALTWVVAQGIANKPFDRALEYNLQALAQLVVVEEGSLRFALDPQTRDLLRADDSDLVYYQLADARGQFVSGEFDLPAPPADEVPEAGRIRQRDDVLRGDAVRVAYTWLARPDPLRPVLLQVAETTGRRSTLANEIIKGVMVPQFVILPLAVLLVWLALVRGIRPLSDLEQRIRARRPDDLSPIEEADIPQEVAPLVSSINDLLARLKVSLTTQRRFLADAAHQLKTPLAGLRMQAELAQRESDPAGLRGSLQQIARSSARATHTVNQLLALARAETTGRTLPSARVDLARLVAAVVRDTVPRALEQGIDLGVEGDSEVPEELQLTGNPTLLQEMVRNLVDNAMAYGGPKGVVTARVLVDRFSGVQLVQVEDNGPGIPLSERALVMQPFYRALGTDVDGSGLGLAIVQEIAQQHGATVHMEDAHPERARPGLRVSVRFVAKQAGE
ncbi:MAG: sensor histidine kinase [Hydrogenophaga sp.]|uniref:sensor histidine kinase n=1 Tax=Hydrogenophaga sp. TaxID=1904254 RepID=UPI0016A0DD93|nr:sensor histidine kinase [Hydrogenophaga sp.]NIM39801.1 sensor histidine kinase [Hydrogenophaga sp.]NIN25005.1 sensor histidine kinase [Hydrogenophaga sp.]NIN29517.1 sensor histidine kinase [Hydrogenophaga sp.]NIN54040.1 sensor histidine kinase [Hydrogenophaga sp.]NIO50244.1 sensor histidine kinase [Hydrogenophaga sp.]